jgi:inosine-uridine nucleoside N-ribohydrolase
MAKQIILDTDIDTDCDDAGALAVLHAMANTGECELRGVVCSVPAPQCAGAVRAINAWYGRPTIPVGLVNVPDYETSDSWKPYRDHHARFLKPNSGADPYNVRLAQTRPADDPPPEDAVRLYRRVLAAAADQSVTICAIGTLTALAQLLESPADSQTPLTGAQLVGRKVCELVTMAVAPFPAGREAFNWRMDPASAAAVIRNWPTPVTVSPHGDRVLTGARFVAAAPAGQPVREAYVAYLGGEGKNRPSWDLIAALYAVRGMSGPFDVSPSRSLTLNSPSGDYQWQPTTDRAAPRRLMMPTIRDDRLTTMLEDLMIASIAMT